MDFDSSYILYIIGAILGIAAIIYFSNELILSLSPISKSLLLILLFGLLLIPGNSIDIQPLVIALYSLSAATYIVFLTYTIGTFNYTVNQTFILLGLSSLLFLGLGYLLHEKGFSLTKPQARNWSIGILIVILALITFDATGAQPTYSLGLEQQVTITQKDRGPHIGAVTATNNFPFPRYIELPDYRGCLYLPDDATREQVDISLHYDYRSIDHHNRITGNTEKRFPLQLGYSSILKAENITSLDNIPIEQMENCPDESDVSLVITPAADSRTPTLPSRQVD